MKTSEIIKLGTTLGLRFNEKYAYKDQLDRDFVVFDVNNAQRFSIDGRKLSDDEILEKIGEYLIEMGKSMKAQEISDTLKY